MIKRAVKLIQWNHTWILPRSLEFVIRKAVFSGFFAISIFLFELFVTLGNFTISPAWLMLVFAVLLLLPVFPVLFVTLFLAYMLCDGPVPVVLPRWFPVVEDVADTVVFVVYFCF